MKGCQSLSATVIQPQGIYCNNGRQIGKWLFVTSLELLPAIPQGSGPCQNVSWWSLALQSFTSPCITLSQQLAKRLDDVRRAVSCADVPDFSEPCGTQKTSVRNQPTSTLQDISCVSRTINAVLYSHSLGQLPSSSYEPRGYVAATRTRSNHRSTWGWLPVGPVQRGRNTSISVNAPWTSR